MTYRLLFAYAFVRLESEQNSSHPTFPRAPHALKQLIEQRLRGASRPISRSAPTRWREKATRISEDAQNSNRAGVTLPRFTSHFHNRRARLQ
jgi:hypothetical protein